MSISFYEEVVVDAQMGYTTTTVGEILEHEDGKFKVMGIWE